MMLVAERRKRITHAQSILFIETLKQLYIEVEDQPLFPKYESFDAAYLDLAMHKGHPLASLDKQLINAASNAVVKLMLVQ